MSSALGRERGPGAFSVLLKEEERTMNLILRFLKPHWKLCALTVVLLVADVAGGLFVPTMVAQMLNQGTSGASLEAISLLDFQSS